MDTSIDENMFVASVDLDAVNNFNPDKSVIPDLYNSFRTAVQAKNNSNNNFKDGFIAEDKPLDESLWLLETSLNTNYGFRQDSFVDFTTNVFEFTINNKSINANGMPVIDGQDLVDVYCEMVETVGYTGSENKFFRLGVVEVSQVTTETSSVILESESGFYWAGVMPPWIDPEPFPASVISMHSTAAAEAYRVKINNETGLLPWQHNPDYIITVWYHGYDGFNNPELWSKPSYSDCTHLLFNDTLNHYLFSTKEFIDLLNPINDPNKWMGRVNIYCFWDHNAIKACHTVVPYILTRVYVGHDPS
ncbi:MAG: hypothetical protein B6I19_01385 [Bacteroidetes bacterium 4572_114]|nr:MAG: hypothetical protein B6I19_01385 [Bacteroidetes bacterium 4572_114]